MKPRVVVREQRGQLSLGVVGSGSRKFLAPLGAPVPALQSGRALQVLFSAQVEARCGLLPDSETGATIAHSWQAGKLAHVSVVAAS